MTTYKVQIDNLERDARPAETAQIEAIQAEAAAQAAAQAEAAEAKAVARQAILDKLGLTADEANALLG